MQKLTVCYKIWSRVISYENNYRGWKRTRRDSSDSEEDEKKPKGGANGNPGVSGYQNVNA